MTPAPNKPSATHFPREFDDLTDTTRCPACFTPLRSTTCGTCGLDLTHPSAAELATVSSEAAVLLRRRVELIASIRGERADATAPAAPPATTIPAPAAAPQPAAGTPATPAATAPAEPRRHLGVQVVLLIVGVSLLAVGAIFFLVYAFITFGLVWRSVIIGAVTLAAFAGAWLLRRRKLAATAEAIAALAVVLVYLDAFAVRANDLFGAAAADGLVYWGITLLVSAVGFVAWHRLSGLRIPSIAGFAAFAPGLAFLIAGLTEPLDTGDRVFAAFAGAAIGGVVHVIASRLGPHHTPERVLALGIGALGLIGAAFSAFFLRPESDWAPAVGLAIVVLLALGHVVVILRSGGPVALGAVIGGIGAAAATVAVWSATPRLDDSTLARIAPTVAAVAVALVLEAVQRHAAGTRARPVTLAATWTAVGVGTLVALPTLILAVATSVEVAGRAVVPGAWSIPGDTALALRPEGLDAIATLAIVVAIVAAVWALTGALVRRRLVVLWAVAAVLVLSAPLTGVLWGAMGAWLLLAAAAVGLLVGARGRGRGIRTLLGTTGMVALALGYTASWASIDTWWVGSLAAVAVLLATRGGVSAAPARAGLLVAAVTVLVVAAGAEAWHGNEVLLGGGGRGLEAVHAVLAVAILVLAVAAVLRRRVLGTLDTIVLFWLGAAIAAVTGLASWAGGESAVALIAPEPTASIVLSLALGVALALWVALPRPRVVERVVAAAALPFAATWLLLSALRPLHLDEQPVVLLTIAVLCLGHVAAFVLGRPPFTTAIGWVSIGLAAATAIAAIARDAIDPLESATAPIAVALLVTGSVQLRRKPAARSWAWLAPGILVLLLPSLVATFTEEALWRLVALGAACVALIVVGALARLQAPLILGSVFVLVHAGRTFAPQLRAIYESTQWWVWAAIGGAIILFLGFTIERRIRNLKSVAARVSALR
jgi:hypothetical protein